MISSSGAFKAPDRRQAGQSFPVEVAGMAAPQCRQVSVLESFMTQSPFYIIHCFLKETCRVVTKMMQVSSCIPALTHTNKLEYFPLRSKPFTDSDLYAPKSTPGATGQSLVEQLLDRGADMSRQ
jgi:hypothetical protein